MKICIDPGHGMSNIRHNVYDPGVVAAGLAEADIALSWAVYIRNALAAAKIPFWMTRDDKKDHNPVATRDNRAVANGCTHLISLHCNGGVASASGAEVYYRTNVDKKWARAILACHLYITKLRSRGTKTEDQSQHSRLAILDFPGPVALLELGFLSNPGDRRIINTPALQAKFAASFVELLKSGTV